MEDSPTNNEKGPPQVINEADQGNILEEELLKQESSSSLFITATELDAQLKSDTPPMLFEIKYGPPALSIYRKPILAQSGFINTDEFEVESNFWKKLNDSDLRKWLCNLGISAESYVMFYCRDGVMDASRAAWVLEYAGVKRVRVLDCGVTGWME